MIPLPRIQPLSETLINAAIEAAGGRRAHEDHDRRLVGEDNADYRLGNAIIELKLLEDEGLDKPERQQKLAALFDRVDEGRPVVVIDPLRLNETEQTEYKKIMQGPIKTGIRKAKNQLRQSRSEDPGITTSVLMFVNVGFSALSHEELVDIATHRAKNDSSEIDGIVVAGCYLHADGFDTFANWNIDYREIREGTQFEEYDLLRHAWGELANKHMTDFVQGKHGEHALKTAQVDVCFDLNGKTYVKPAISFGITSEFYRGRRPRKNVLQPGNLSSVAVTVPTMTADEFRRLSGVFPDVELMASHEEWRRHVQEALATSIPLQPVLPISVTRGGYEAWRRRNGDMGGDMGLRHCANERFSRQMAFLLTSAVEMKEGVVPPRLYVAVQTELIGQDADNDISHIFLVRSTLSGNQVKPILENARLQLSHALALGAAHAISLGIGQICWREDLEYAWT